MLMIANLVLLMQESSPELCVKDQFTKSSAWETMETTMDLALHTRKRECLLTKV
jgi:hypothetical protein